MKKEACFGCNYTGYLLVENDVHGTRIEKCSACDYFDSDDEAVEFVFNMSNLYIKTMKEIASYSKQLNDRAVMCNKGNPLDINALDATEGLE